MKYSVHPPFLIDLLSRARSCAVVPLPAFFPFDIICSQSNPECAERGQIYETYIAWEKADLNIKEAAMIGEIPIEKKYNLTLDEAAEFAGIDATRMRNISDEEESLVIWIGRRR